MSEKKWRRRDSVKIHYFTFIYRGILTLPLEVQKITQARKSSQQIVNRIGRKIFSPEDTSVGIAVKQKSV